MTQPSKKLITHSGSFHADDIFACATLSIMLEKKGESFEIIRTRDEEIIKTGDYVFDVGGIYDADMNKFDHHQVGGAGKRENGIEYASFGLVWQKLGEEVCGNKDVAERIEKAMVQPIDAGDNGIEITKQLFRDVQPYKIENIFGIFLPTALENLDKDKQFMKVFEWAREILQREIIKNTDAIKIEKIIQECYARTADKRILIIESTIMPRYEVQQAVHTYPELLYAVFPSVGDWNVLAIKKEIDSFGSKKPFPKTWGGLSGEELQKVTEVSDAIFCHNKLFLAVATSKEGAIKLAELALKN